MTTDTQIPLNETEIRIFNNIIDSVTLNKSADGVSVTITDEALDQALSLDNNNEVLVARRKHKSGKTTLKFLGKKRNGNIDIYLSKNALNRIKKGGIGLGVSLVLALIAAPLLIPVAGGSITGVSGSALGALMGKVGTLGVSWVVFMQGVRKLVTAVVSQTFSKFKAGRIYKIRHWHYSGWSYQ